MHSIILASTSPRRRELLSRLGLKFKTVASDYEEDMGLHVKPKALSIILSRGKAEAVAKSYPKHIIIAADTFVTHGDRLLGKPHTPLEAKKMLKLISGKSLTIITGFTIKDSRNNKTISESVETKVQIKKLSPLEIDNYIKTKEPLDKAGAFAIQGIGAIFIKKIEGDFLGAVGLPLYNLAESLKKFGINVLLMLLFYNVVKF